MNELIIDNWDLT